ncbi:MAG: D-alanyl-D-alanine carboxypeptidase/D-alanyl-D-alanine-endopeptidase [bacterium]|nr:D-alanyl-D-alanine carboxypeptidase/D-alanyl-D-alanine-endopeptidase [bacterium]
MIKRMHASAPACLAACLLTGLCVATAAGQTIQQQIDAIFDALPGSHTLSGRVESEDGGTVYYTRDAAATKKPASVTKAFVVGTCLALLGPDHRFATRVYRDGTIDGSGLLNGDLILLGNHDFTWAADYYPGSARFALDRLAEQLYDQGLRSVSGTVWGYGYLMYAEVPSTASAADAFRDALLDAGISVNATATSSSFNPPGVPLAEWRSMPLSQACRELLKVSDNDDAQALLRHLAWELMNASSDSVGEDVVQDWLESQGVDMTGSVFLEGAGLSHSNRVSALQAIGLTRTMLQSPLGSTFAAMLPIGGVDGTLGSRYTTGPAYGQVHAKTGTLTGVITLSGYIVNPVDNQRYLFAFLMNDIGGFNNTTARAAIDDAVAIMAGDVQQAGGSVPGPVTLQSVVGDSDTASALLSWTPASGADGYNVYRSQTGSVWAFETNTAATSAIVGGLQDGDTHYFAVRAANAYGESKASDAYGVRLVNGPHRVLVVDGNDRWEGGLPENREQLNHEFAVRLAEAVTPTVALDTCTNEAVVGGAIDLSNYGAVLWLLGEESTADETFSAAEQSAVQAYLLAGGNLLVSGAEIGWDLDHLGSTGDRAFYNTTLKADYVADDAGTEQFVADGGIFASLPEAVGDFHPTWQVISYPDVIAPLGGAVANLSYLSDTGVHLGTAGVQYDGPYRLIHLGFPFETIADRPTRQTLMNRILGFFFDTEFPDELLIEARNLAGTILGPPTLQEAGNWLDSTAKSQVHALRGRGSRFIEYVLPNSGTDLVLITPDVPVGGWYDVSMTWGLGANCYDARHTVRHADGTDVVLVDQIPLGTPGANAHTWVSLGEYRFEAGASAAAGSIEVSEATVSGRPSAVWNQRVYFDALRLVLRERSPNPGDFDFDGDTDLDDYAVFFDCLAGPESAPDPPPPVSAQDCLDAFDFDGDFDVDALDYGEFALSFDATTP